MTLLVLRNAVPTSEESKMDIETFLSHENLHLPLEQGVKGRFRTFVDSILLDYENRAKQVGFPRGEKSKSLKRLGIIIDGIKKSVNDYYDGKPFDAYLAIQEGITKSGLKDYWDNLQIDENSNHYRIRLVSNNYSLGREQLFHIPFDKRGKVSTQRYSIPGYPSLYLSNSIYTAWEELRRPKLDDIQAIRFVNQRALKVMDLTTSRYGAERRKNRTFLEQQYDFLMWPLIAVCSIKVQDVDDFFKPEYIVPQLLLQWIRNHETVVGIKFSSTHIDLNSSESEGEFYNVVIPVVENKEEGYCSVVSEMFKSTDVLSWQLLQFSSGSASFSYNIGDDYAINPAVQRVEMVVGRPFPYFFSPLADIERILKTMRIHSMEFGDSLP